MNISNDTEEILNFLDYASGDNLRKRNDLAVILEMGAMYGESNLVEDILFAGASVWNLYSTIKKISSSDEAQINLNIELNSSINNLRQFLNDILGTEFPDINKRFNENYFS